LLHTFLNPSERGSFFGTSVSISGSSVLVGAHLENFGVHFKAGAAYLFIESLTVVGGECEIDVDAPVVSGITVSLNPVPVNTVFDISAIVTDTCSFIDFAEYSTDGILFTRMIIDDGESKSVTATANSISSGFEAAILTVCVRGTDVAGNTTSIPECVLLPVYDPNGGFVTGGGWIDSPVGAYAADPLAAGKANFGFVSKYKKGAAVPTGQSAFNFKNGDLDFHSSEYDWLVVTGNNYAKYKGTGTINGEGAYKFMLWAGDGEPDTFRIKIWEEDALGDETVTYDNGTDQAIGGGNIVVHTGGNNKK
ncbi:MAG: hypothetical protein ACUZ8O_06435, partial [Candidatus Anammoxibacter sp.]